MNNGAKQILRRTGCTATASAGPSQSRKHTNSSLNLRQMRAIACTAGTAGNVREQFDDCMSSWALARHLLSSCVHGVVSHLHSGRRLNKYFKCNYLVFAINSCRRKRWSFDGWSNDDDVVSGREMIFRIPNQPRIRVRRNQWFEFAAISNGEFGWCNRRLA